jgi:hypothetical protein
LSAFDFLKETNREEYYNSFIESVSKKENQDAIHAFLVNEYMNILYDYERYIEYHNKHWWNEENPSLRFIDICKKLHANGEIHNIIFKGLKIARNKETYNPDSNAGNLANSFADILVEQMKKDWNVASAFSYSDDFDFGSYMEHDFMWQVIANEPKHLGKYVAIARNEH